MQNQHLASGLACCRPPLSDATIQHVDNSMSGMACARNPLARAGKHKIFFPRSNETSARWASDGLWRQQLPAIFSELQKSDIAVRDGQVYEFGLFRGDSMRTLRRMAPFSHARTYGFDSFEGLPRDFAQNERRQWHSGQFRADPRSSLLRDLDSTEAPIHFVAGFFDKSLSEPGLVRRLDMGPAKYVDIDVDLYSSTVTLLDFLFSHRLLVPGTVVGYDDFWSTSCSADSPAVASPLTNGEGRAHLQAAHRFNATFTCLAGGCRASHHPQQVKFPGHCGAFGAIFLVTSICNPQSNRDLTAGFQMSTEDIVSFKKHNPVCRTHWAKV